MKNILYIFHYVSQNRFSILRAERELKGLAWGERVEVRKEGKSYCENTTEQILYTSENLRKNKISLFRPCEKEKWNLGINN